MVLTTAASHPGCRTWVVKLHRDADPARGELRGRVEHLASGRWFEFEDGGALLALLARKIEFREGEAPWPAG